MYTKFINNRQVFSDCRTIELNGTWISNPTEEQILAAGWEIYVEPTPIIPEYVAKEPDILEILNAVKTMLSSSVENLSDEDALNVAALFPTWNSRIGKAVSTGERLWYNEKLYKVIQNHTVQENWTPDVTASLYAEISIAEWPDWVQPLGAETAYQSGDQVTHNQQHWTSDVDNNVWEPGVYGWTVAE